MNNRLTDHDASASERLQSMIRRLSHRGVRITKQRRLALCFFLETPGFASAMDVYTDLAHKCPGVSYDTVYRNIRLFAEIGLIEQFVLDGSVRFKLSCSGHEHFEHYHLICVSCEKTIPRDYEPHKLFADLPGQFQPVKYKFDVYGYCSDCSEGRESRQAAGKAE